MQLEIRLTKLFGFYIQTPCHRMIKITFFMIFTFVLVLISVRSSDLLFQKGQSSRFISLTDSPDVKIQQRRRVWAQEHYILHDY